MRVGRVVGRWFAFGYVLGSLLRELRRGAAVGRTNVIGVVVRGARGGVR